MHSYRGFWLTFLSAIVICIFLIFAAASRVTPSRPQQRLVESVDITGNRRLRKDDILYYVQTRPGDPYNEAASSARSAGNSGAGLLR